MISQDTAYTLIDFSHIIENGLITYPGLPAVKISEYLSRETSREFYSGRAEFRIGQIEMVGNTGTYLDAPSHRHIHGKDLAALPLHAMAGLEAQVVRVPYQKGRIIDASHLQGTDVSGKAVLIHTGWSEYWGKDAYFRGHSFMTEAAARYLVKHQAGLVGIDSLNIDDTRDPNRPVHTLLLDNEIPIVEHLTNLDNAPDDGFRFFAVPAKVRHLDSFPVRAFGLQSR